jgi:hypothetical protein
LALLARKVPISQVLEDLESLLVLLLRLLVLKVDILLVSWHRCSSSQARVDKPVIEIILLDMVIII